MYELVVPPRLGKLLAKMKKKDQVTYSEYRKKMERILDDPHHNAHPLRSKYKGVWEAHLRNKLIMYKIDEATLAVELVDIIDHDAL